MQRHRPLIAESHRPEESQAIQQLQQLAELRQIAQSHLTDIEREDVQESREESRRQEERERDRRVSATNCSKADQMDHKSSSNKRQKLRPAQGRPA